MLGNWMRKRELIDNSFIFWSNIGAYACPFLFKIADIKITYASIHAKLNLLIQTGGQ
jgi:hypothetical protein